ncbi:MAG: hypothetical protein EBR01_00800 [Proteobacteria bacterium]|nr:hypothetical protein [Pseudomonadota bacterium]
MGGGVACDEGKSEGGGGGYKLLTLKRFSFLTVSFFIFEKWPSEGHLGGHFFSRKRISPTKAHFF